MLVWLLQTQKEVRIERLAATLQLPILQSSRRRHIQRFLQVKALSILIVWFPIVKEVIARQFRAGSQLVIALDRTQWKEYNVLMVSAIVQKRAFPIFWTLLDKHGASNLVEQQQVLRPVIRLLKRYKLVIIGSARISQYRADPMVTPPAFEFCSPSKKQHYFLRKKTAISIAKQHSGSTRNSFILSESRIYSKERVF
jgi:hypothetical protein